MTLLVSSYPLVVTDVRQGGDSIPWHQDGGGVLVLGLSLLAAPTTVEFEIDGRRGTCEYRPDGERCELG